MSELHADYYALLVDSIGHPQKSHASVNRSFDVDIKLLKDLSEKESHKMRSAIEINKAVLHIVKLQKHEPYKYVAVSNGMPILIGNSPQELRHDFALMFPSPTAYVSSIALPDNRRAVSLSRKTIGVYYQDLINLLKAKGVVKQIVLVACSGGGILSIIALIRIGLNAISPLAAFGAIFAACVISCEAILVVRHFLRQR